MNRRKEHLLLSHNHAPPFLHKSRRNLYAFKWGDCFVTAFENNQLPDGTNEVSVLTNYIDSHPYRNINNLSFETDSAIEVEFYPGGNAKKAALHMKNLGFTEDH